MKLLRRNVSELDCVSAFFVKQLLFASFCDLFLNSYLLNTDTIVSQCIHLNWGQFVCSSLGLVSVYFVYFLSFHVCVSVAMQLIAYKCLSPA